MLIAEFRADGDLFADARERAPETVLFNEEEYIADDDVRLLFWAEGGDVAAFEEAIEDDPTVTALRTLAETNDRRLYRADLSAEGVAETTLPIWREQEIVPLEVTGTAEGWEVRMRFPDRDGLAAYRDALRERGIDFELRALYSEVDADSPSDAALTDAQTDALVTAYEAGYYDVPRETSQSEVATRLEIASQSVSERLRRGTATLIEATLL